MMKDWTQEMFRVFCILSGCDYNPHLTVNGLGIQTAAKLVHCYRDRAVEFVCARYELPCNRA